MTDDLGQPFMLDLEHATILADGDGLIVDGGGTIRVCALAEAVLEVRAATPDVTARLAWHLGNRHTPVQILADGALRLRDDRVIAALLDRLGATVSRCRAPFDPEPGAYADHREEGRE